MPRPASCAPSGCRRLLGSRVAAMAPSGQVPSRVPAGAHRTSGGLRRGPAGPSDEDRAARAGHPTLAVAAEINRGVCTDQRSSCATPEPARRQPAIGSRSSPRSQEQVHSCSKPRHRTMTTSGHRRTPRAEDRLPAGRGRWRRSAAQQRLGRGPGRGYCSLTTQVEKCLARHRPVVCGPHHGAVLGVDGPG